MNPDDMPITPWHDPVPPGMDAPLTRAEENRLYPDGQTETTDTDECQNCGALNGHICKDCGTEIMNVQCKENNGLCDLCALALKF